MKYYCSQTKENSLGRSHFRRKDKSTWESSTPETQAHCAQALGSISMLTSLQKDSTTQEIFFFLAWGTAERVHPKLREGQKIKGHKRGAEVMVHGVKGLLFKPKDMIADP